MMGMTMIGTWSSVHVYDNDSRDNDRYMYDNDGYDNDRYMYDNDGHDNDMYDIARYDNVSYTTIMGMKMYSRIIE